MITDRDIALRGVAKGLQPQAKVRDAMSEEVKRCYEDDDTEDVLKNMGNIQLRRLPVVSRDRRLVGVVAITGLTSGGDARESGS